LLDLGVNSIGTKRSPGRFARLSASANFFPSTHGAPNVSNG
jgi:hypothetical protein